MTPPTYPAELIHNHPPTAVADYDMTRLDCSVSDPRIPRMKLIYKLLWEDVNGTETKKPSQFLVLIIFPRKIGITFPGIRASIPLIS